MQTFLLLSNRFKATKDGGSLRTLLLGADKLISEFIASSLRSAGHDVVIINDGLLGYKAAQLEEFNSIIIDVDIPQKNGILICKELRKIKINTPILLISSTNSEEECVEALDSGADDFVRRPFGFQELNARIRAITRRPCYVAMSNLSYGDLSIIAEKRLVKKAGEYIQLRNKEFELLQYFMQNPDVVLSKQKILKDLWNVSVSTSSNRLEVHINNLRKKLQDSANSKRRNIVTVRNIGYKFKSLWE